jgi:hypothetical protein
LKNHKNPRISSLDPSPSDKLSNKLQSYNKIDKDISQDSHINLLESKSLTFDPQNSLNTYKNIKFEDWAKKKNTRKKKE